ncbi:hypothetical protein RBU61_11110 [Tissierella sp. MB52-C2]|uniref:hypothetical protein n=1 Tax=Tissierella sp. MB52-C2 TaxID=3070999 RepID=UPI00280C1FDA|nr:hypothetical protein [Tissierella sp. MB52-C2]WMM23502.1 hypothetical protein RBU61_11110 [Tissierella sp. MB52-C2]
MSGPILFFIFIIVTDLILKSVKDKQKIEESKKKRMPEMNRQPQQSRTLGDLKKILDEELQRERQRGFSKRQDKTIEKKNIRVSTREKAGNIDRGLKRDRYSEESNSMNISEDLGTLETPRSMESLNSTNIDDKKEELREDILRGIIFSEILSPPKSIQNQRRSL